MIYEANFEIIQKKIKTQVHHQTWTHDLCIMILPLYLCTTSACDIKGFIYKQILVKQTLVTFCLKFTWLGVGASL
jgi:hypothetical protein